jgi:penicillin-binding protein activator
MKITAVAFPVLLGGTVAFLAGCASVKTVDVSKAPAITAKYDQGDLLTWGQLMSDSILSHPFPPAGESQPIVVDMGIQNRTGSHIDTQAIADTITTKLMDSGKVRIANAARRDELLKEQGYQLANCTEQTRTQIGRQLGAKYMLTGSLVEISEKEAPHVRMSKQQDVYYQLTCEITDLETGLILLRKQKDRLRTATKPVVGW